MRYVKPAVVRLFFFMKRNVESSLFLAVHQEKKWF